MNANEKKSPVKPRTTVMKQLYVLGRDLTRKFGDHLGDNGIEMRRRLVDRLEKLAEIHNAGLRNSAAKIVVPSDSSLKNILGANPSYYVETQTASIDHRKLLAQAAGFEGWSDYVEKHYQVHAYLQEAALAPRSVFEKMTMWVGGFGVIASLLSFREPGPRIGLHGGWAWAILGLLLLGLALVLVFRAQVLLFRRTETVVRPGWMKLYMKLFPSQRYLWLFLVTATLAVLAALQLVFFRPVRFAFAPEEFGRTESVLVHRETGAGLRPLLELKGEASRIVWLPVGTTGLLINFKGQGYPIGDRLQVPIGFFTIDYTFP